MGTPRPISSRPRLTDTLCPQNHQYQCPRYPVPCPNQCGTPSIAREDVPTHLKESCNTAMLLCPFKDAGCKHRVSLSLSLYWCPCPHPTLASLCHCNHGVPVPHSIPTPLPCHLTHPLWCPCSAPSHPCGTMVSPSLSRLTLYCFATQVSLRHLNQVSLCPHGIPVPSSSSTPMLQ